MTGTLESNVSVTVDLLDGTAKGFVCSCNSYSNFKWILQLAVITWILHK